MRFDLDDARTAFRDLTRRYDIPKRMLISVGVGLPILIVLVAILVVQLTSGSPPRIDDIEPPDGADVATDLRSVVGSNPRWANVRILPAEVEGHPQIMVMGTVPTSADLNDLKSRIADDAGGMNVDWQVAVFPDEG